MWVVQNGPKAYKKISLVPDAGRQNWNLFIGNVRTGQMHPRLAAAAVGQVDRKPNMDYKKFQNDQYQIRICSGQRATFQVQEGNGGGILTVLQVGGHT